MKYSDFDPNLDEVAAWTIGGLVAGKVLAKAGILAVIHKYFHRYEKRVRFPIPVLLPVSLLA